MILLIDDEITHQMMVTALLRDMGYHTAHASNGRDALYSLEKKKNSFIDLVLLDLNMPQMNGLEVLEILRQRYPDLPVIMLTGSTDIRDVVKAIKMGAVDFINKPAQPEHLRISIKNALRISSLSQEVARLKRKEVKATTFADIIGAQGGLAKVINIATRAAYSDVPVLISGEMGVGKELLSAAIHGESRRVGKPFVEVNCASIPDNRVDGELFGRENVTGKFQEADGGTISLYEVTELSSSVQAKLLKLLQQKTVEPLNGTRATPIDARIIASSSKNIAQEVRLGNFREDLYFRLNVLNINVPPLRERTEDILPLIHHFIGRFSASENLPRMGLTEQAEYFLQSHEWTGNVRQLQNVIHRAMLLSDKYRLDVNDFTYALSEIGNSKHNDSSAEHPRNPYSISMLSATGKLKTAENLEQEAMTIALKHHNNNVTQAAKSLNMAKSTFYKKMKKAGLLNIENEKHPPSPPKAR